MHQQTFFLRFEPTYKELKLRKMDFMNICLMRFEPTYKELKQFSEWLSEWAEDLFWAYL